MKLNCILQAAALAAALIVPMAHAAPGSQLLEGKCAACHSLTKPVDGGPERVVNRKGPDLYYSAVKFNKDWLVGWLQKPTVIRQGGAAFMNVVKPGAPGTPDVIDATKLQPHLALSAEEAAAAADALMDLGKGDDVVSKGAYKQDPPNNSMATLLFNKLRGCSSCHSNKQGSGGASGPELYTAGDRLQPDFIVEYIRNPQKFDPHVWMPKLDLNEADIQKLTGYLTTLKQGGSK